MKKVDLSPLFNIVWNFAKGVYPLVHVRIFGSSGARPTRFQQKSRFEWAATHSFLSKCTFQVGCHLIDFNKIANLCRSRFSSNWFIACHQYTLGSLPAQSDSFSDSSQIFFCDFTRDDLNNLRKKTDGGCFYFLPQSGIIQIEILKKRDEYND